VGETSLAVHIKFPGRLPTASRCSGCGLEWPHAQSGAPPPGGGFLCEKCRERLAPTVSGATPISPEERSTVRSSRPFWSVADYEFLRKLGETHMSVVYLARRKRDGLEVAVKLMTPWGEVTEQARRMFLREMHVLSALRHPGIVTYIESQFVDKVIYCVMEYCNQGNALGLMAQHGGVLPMDTGVRLLRQVLEGLAFAHERSFVHRDIKPENVLIHETGALWQAKLADFGLAKSFDKAGCSGLTATGTYGGTWAYMSREQLLNFKYAKPVSDVWSMAATFYTLVTGQQPRAAYGATDPIEAVLNGEIVPIRERVSEVPSQLAGIIDLALARDPEDRFPSAVEFYRALVQVTGSAV
jgi:serine/threonine protein kinase